MGRLVRTTEAAMVRGASVVSSSSGILSFGDSDMARVDSNSCEAESEVWIQRLVWADAQRIRGLKEV